MHGEYATGITSKTSFANLTVSYPTIDNVIDASLRFSSSLDGVEKSFFLQYAWKHYFFIFFGEKLVSKLKVSVDVKQ